MDITYSYKYLDLFVVLFGLVFIIFFVSKRFARQRTMRFGNFEVLEKIYHPKRFQIAFIPLILRLVVIVLIVLAISDLQIVQQGFVSNTDFVLAIDTSSSMLTPDYEPDRLALAKKTTIEWLAKLKDTRIGVVTFAGNAYTQTKPIDDLELVSGIVDRISLDQPAGTAIGEALITSSSILHGTDRNKTIILITDGRNNIGVNISDALRSVKNEKIKIIAIGIGSNENEDVTVPTELIGLNATAADVSGLDEDTLRYLANETGGKYFPIHDAQSFKAAFDSGVETKNVTQEVKTYLLIAACIVLLFEWAFEITKYRPIP